MRGFRSLVHAGQIFEDEERHRRSNQRRWRLSFQGPEAHASGRPELNTIDRIPCPYLGAWLMSVAAI